VEASQSVRRRLRFWTLLTPDDKKKPVIEANV
jgi:hypothetical protein